MELPGADLSGLNFAGANLSGADLSSSLLQRCNLRGAILDGGTFTDADLTDADLEGASLFRSNLRNAVLPDGGLSSATILDTVMPDGSYGVNDPDAEVLAYTASGELLAPLPLYKKLRDNLKLIRTAYPAVADIHSPYRFIAGRVLVRTSATTQEQLLSFGEFSKHDYSFGWSSVIFGRHYNPRILAKLIGNGAESDGLVGDGNRLTYDLASDTFTFSIGWGDCPSGCIGRHTWVFKVANGIDVELVSESGPPVPTTVGVSANRVLRASKASLPATGGIITISKTPITTGRGSWNPFPGAPDSQSPTPQIFIQDVLRGFDGEYLRTFP